MKKTLIISLLAVPALTFAVPAETTGTAPLAVDFDMIQELNNTEDYVNYRKGRSGDSGFRAMNYRPFSYNNANLVNKTYKKNTADKMDTPGVVIGESCRWWKNCLQDTYRKTRGYNRIVMKHSNAKPVISNKAKTRGNYRGRLNQQDGAINGRYKLMHWNR